MIISMKNMAGENVGEVELKPAIFEAPVNISLMHQALTRQLANARQGTVKTKNRSEVNGSTRKMWKQKGTGHARQGSRKAPHWRSGGDVFGPRPRNYDQKMPLKMRHAALRSALSVKAADKHIVVLDTLELDAPKTKMMNSVLVNLQLSPSTLVLLPAHSENIERSIRNITGVMYLRAQYLNVRDLLGHDTIVMPKGALEVIEGLLG